MSASPGRAEQRVLIVEDHQLFAEAVDLALTVEGYDVRRIEVPADPASPGALVTAIIRQRPRVVLLDLDLGRFGDGVRLIEPIARSGANVIVVTGSVDRARWGDAVRSGARKVLSKSQPLRDILATVRRIIAGLPVMDREEREELVVRVDPVPVRGPGGPRTARPAHRPRERGARPPDEGARGPRDRRAQRGLRGDRPYPGEVDPGQARGVLAAGRGGHGPRDRLAACLIPPRASARSHDGLLAALAASPSARRACRARASARCARPRASRRLLRSQRRALTRVGYSTRVVLAVELLLGLGQPDWVSRDSTASAARSTWNGRSLRSVAE